MAQLGHNIPGPGTLVSDSLEANLLTGATLNAAGTTNGTAARVDRPGEVAFVLETATVTGTTPTISIVVTGSDDSGFGSGVVTYGTVTLLTGAASAQSNVRRSFNAKVYKTWVRAAVTVAGTSPVYTGSTLKVKQPDYFRAASTSAAA
jgi:hypothetical protein